MTEDRCEVYRRHKAAHAAYCAGDIDALRAALDALEDAEAVGFTAGVDLMRGALAARRRG